MGHHLHKQHKQPPMPSDGQLSGVTLQVPILCPVLIVADPLGNIIIILAIHEAMS